MNNKNFHRVSISVGMATYNGAKYLREQLDSICSQLLLPDELVVCDDGSSDATKKILRDFEQVSPFKFRLYENNSNLGYSHNFGKVIDLCSCDLIFLSDQDDIWHPTKILQMADSAIRNPRYLLFLNDAEIVLADGFKTGLTIQQQLMSLGLSDRQFSPGCCMMIRKPLKSLILPIPERGVAHDSWINLISMNLSVKTIRDDILQSYRRHGENVTNSLDTRVVRQNRTSLVKSYIKRSSSLSAQTRLSRLEVLAQRISDKSSLVDDLCDINLDHKIILSNIEKEMNAVRNRIKYLTLPIFKRIVHIAYFFVTGNYHYFNGWKSFVKDLISRPSVPNDFVDFEN